MTDKDRDSPDGDHVLWPGKRVRRSAAGHPAVGMWKDNPLVQDVDAFIRRIRRPRYEQLFREWREERSGRQLSEGQNDQ